MDIGVSMRGGVRAGAGFGEAENRFRTMIEKHY